MATIASTFDRASTIAQVLKRLAENGPLSQYAMCKLPADSDSEFDSWTYRTVHRAVRELERRGFIELVRQEKNSKNVTRKIYGLSSFAGLMAAMAYVQEGLDMEAVRRQANAALIQGLEEFERDFLRALIDIWLECDKEGLIRYSQFSLFTYAGSGDILAQSYLLTAGLVGFFEEKYRSCVGRMLLKYPSLDRMRQQIGQGLIELGKNIIDWKP